MELTEKDKELLLIDLSTRLPYHVIVNNGEEDLELVKIDILNRKVYLFSESILEFDISEVKPYLRPYSDMTPEEVGELGKIGWRVDELAYNEPWAHDGSIWSILDGLQYLITRHFDIYGLIEKDLAIKSKKGMYNS